MVRRILILALLLLLGLSIAALIFVGYSYFTHKATSTTTTSNSVSVPLPTSIAKSVDSQPGFSAPKDNNRGDHVVTVVGQLSKAVSGPGDHYSFELKVTNEGRKYTVSIDLGPKDFIITEYSITTTAAPTLDNPKAVKISQQLSGITAQALFDRYKGKIGQIIALDIITQMKPTSPCSDLCTAKLSLYETYANTNKLLEKPNSINSKEILRIGAVSQMTGGNYAR